MHKLPFAKLLSTALVAALLSGTATVAVENQDMLPLFQPSVTGAYLAGRRALEDMSLEEAAMDLGARPWKVFFLITLPLIAPALVAGWLLAFTLSLDDLVIANFTSGPGASTLPMVVYSKMKFGVTPEINALATIVIVTVTAAISLAGWLMFRRGARPG